MKHYTVEEIKASYVQKQDWERQFPVSYYLFRPLSFPLTSLLSRLTNSPQTIAWAGLCAGAAACALLALRGCASPWPGIAGLALFALLDAVDGNMARVTGSVTRYGKLLDGALGKLVEGAYLPALSAGLYFSRGEGLQALLHPHSAWLLLSGFIALAAMLYASYIESAYDSMRKEAATGERDPGAKIGHSRFRGNILYAVFINLHAFNLQLILLGLAALLHREDLFLAFISSYYAVRLAVIYPYYLAKARTELG